MQNAHTLTKGISKDVGFDNYKRTHVECSLFITLYLGSKGIDCVISEPCYKGTISLRNYRIMTMKCSFFYISLVKLSRILYYNSLVKLPRIPL